MKEFALPKELGEKWVQALRSGLYKQDTEHAQYKYQDCFCAWGVFGEANNLEFESENKCLIDGKDINIFAGSLFQPIYRLNDTFKKKFPEIADFIVENVEFI